jgi:hypothetical protein
MRHDVKSTSPSFDGDVLKAATYPNTSCEKYPEIDFLKETLNIRAGFITERRTLWLQTGVGTSHRSADKMRML